MTRDGEQGVVYEAEVGRKVLTDGRRKEEEGEERGKMKGRRNMEVGCRGVLECG